VQGVPQLRAQNEKSASLATLTVIAVLALPLNVRAADPLRSWNDGQTKKAIIGFVERVTKEGSPDFVRPEERIATFDWKTIFPK